MPADLDGADGADAAALAGGALAHVAEGAAVPEHQGALSTTYSIEVVDW